MCTDVRQPNMIFKLLRFSSPIISQFQVSDLREIVDLYKGIFARIAEMLLIAVLNLLCQFLSPLSMQMSASDLELNYFSVCGNAPIKSKLQHPPPPRANPGHLTIFCARGVGNLTGKSFPGVGNLTFAWVGWGKLNRKCQVSNGFFFGRRVANSYEHVRVWTRWKSLEEEI